MTALDKYQRLEAAGRWRGSAEAELRDVIVSFGDATIVLTDLRTEIPLSHWSLPAVMRLNPGKIPAQYAPGPDDAEMVEVDDELMIAAIEKVHDVIEANRPHRGRLRGWMVLLGLLIAAGAGAAWGPSALLRHAADIAPPAQRAEIGRLVLADLEKTAGTACSRPAGDMVRHKLAARLLGPEADIVVLPTAQQGARRLPGPITVIGTDLIGEGATPEILAGHLLAAQARAAESDPMLEALRQVGPRGTVQLLTNGSLPPAALSGYAEKLLAGPPPRPEDEPLLGFFARAGVSSEPYARALDPTGEAVLGLIEADPFRTATPKPVLGERDWAALRQICDQ
ncbi:MULTISPECIES: hypothetical protein [Paracoccus]|uniref:Uncharacterized protein n=1 Tax=Paracoccus litorisediminis TaxID=2006130 RepID=A0A844HF92_9RHOB|nr:MULTISPECIES: hypothetical protein [Paracoccus]MBD9525759.1 hypothetical protein [Paracoccus sp. PAR01]MTH58210.1 hypothetical protein [Paracoccus litorisediminis]